MKQFFTWKRYHRWVGLIMAVFMLVFCVSGIILNHRSLFKGCEVSRSWLPSGYHIRNFNNGVVKGTLSLSPDSVLVFGGAGVWLTDRQAENWSSFNGGLPQGADLRNIRNLVQTKDGMLWCAAQYTLYRYNGQEWQTVLLPKNEERLSDLTLTPDSMGVVVLTRSRVYQASSSNALKGEEGITLKAPQDYTPTTTLFKTVWKLHSGEFFGLAGRLVVDAVAVVLILLSVTGIVLFILPYDIRRKRRLGAKEETRRRSKQMVWNLKWHNRLGYFTLILTLWLAVTGMCLRPPLMIPLALTKVSQKVEEGNVWKDKLRGIRWDKGQGCWLVSTSEGFLKVDEKFQEAPYRFPSEQAPAISPMGITVFEPLEAEGKVSGGWLIGSFSGLYCWNPQTGEVTDFFTGKQKETHAMRPVSSAMVSGYSNDFGKTFIFDYARGAKTAAGQVSEELKMPRALEQAKMSLWNVALELHVGRCYTPFLGPLSELFVFLSGLLISLTLVSGYLLFLRQKRRKNMKGMN